MIQVMVSLLAGIALSRLVNGWILRANDKVFMVVSTSFVFIMGISLGLSRTMLTGVGGLLATAIALAMVASLGSIIFTSLMGKLIFNK